MVECPLKSENDVQDLTRVEDQVRVDDDVLTAKLPDRKSNRNRAVYDTSPKASLPERRSSRNRTVFKKAESYGQLPARSATVCAADMTRENPAKRRVNTVK